LGKYTSKASNKFLIECDPLVSGQKPGDEWISDDTKISPGKQIRSKLKAKS
jgi:hypothetical protein